MTALPRNATWRAFPSLSGVKVWIDARDAAGRALRLYHPASRAGRMAKSLASHCPRVLLSLVCRGQPDAATQDRLQLAEVAIRRQLGDAVAAVSISPGTAGHHRKLTAQVSDRKGVLAYVKVADSPAIAQLLDNEASMLNWIAKHDLGLGVVPEMIDLRSANGLTLLAQGAPPTSARPRHIAPDEKDAAFLTSLQSTARSVVPLGQVLDQCYEAYPHRGDDSLTVLHQAVESAVTKILPSRHVTVAACHGDYVPWNCLNLSDGRLFVFDWEYSRKEGSILGDLFHRVLMPERLVRCAPAAPLVRRLLLLESDPVLGGVVTRSGVTSPELPAYLLLHLLQMACRSRAQEGSVSPYLIECVRACVDTINSARRPRNILIAAYACEPNKGSEPGVGWQMCQAISQTHKSWVITKHNNRASIEAALAARPNENLQFSYVDLPGWLTFWKKGERGIRTYYYLWQFAAWREARRLGRRVDFDLAHHVTFVNDWIFSFLALLPYPFVWGPIGSNPKIPACLTSSVNALLLDRLRFVLRSSIRLFDPLFWYCVHRAAVVVGITADVVTRPPFSVLAKNKFTGYPAIGVEAEQASVESADGSRRFRVLSVGRFIETKAFHLTIRAFAQLARKNADADLLIIGRGSRKDKLEKLVRSLGMYGRVQFNEWLPRQEALRSFGRADVFLLPSFEGGGMVVLEAMAHGLPVVCLKYGGPGEMVSQDCGFAVEVGSLEETAARLALALENLAGNRELRLSMGRAARRRVHEHYLWHTRGDTLNRWYGMARPY